MDPQKWITVAQLAATENTTPRQVYSALDSGMRHSRIGRRIRVRLGDWHAWHESHVVGEAE